MDHLEQFLLPYLDIKTAKSIFLTSKLKMGLIKIKACLIEKWWRERVFLNWVKCVYSNIGVPPEKESFICKFCKKNESSDFVYLNHDFIFLCSKCYASLEIDVIHDVFPLLYAPLHARMQKTILIKKVHFKEIYPEYGMFFLGRGGFEEREDAENCRTQ